MPLELMAFADKLLRYRKQFDATIAQVAEATGISAEILSALEAGERQPSGDQVLILADYYKCDYNFFISNEQLAPFEQTENLFRRFGNELSPSDRWAIQEFLFLCENEAFLAKELGRTSQSRFKFTKEGTFLKRHGEEAARLLRSHLGYGPQQIPEDVFSDFRRIGIHVFRRRLENSNISGLFVKHPMAGKCVLINYSEDVYRQRFTAAHEAGHSILDDEKEFVVSFAKWDHNDLIEVRANTFAGNFLIPAGSLKHTAKSTWNKESIVDFADKLRVNVDVLLIALKRDGVLNDNDIRNFRGLKIPRGAKLDPELPSTLSDKGRRLKVELLQRGISTYYAQLCFDAYQQDSISVGRLAEMMLVTERELWEIGTLFGWAFKHDS